MKISQYIAELQKIQIKHGDIEVLETDDEGWSQENYISLDSVGSVTYFENLEQDIGKPYAKIIRDEHVLPVNHDYTTTYIVP